MTSTDPATSHDAPHLSDESPSSSVAPAKRGPRARTPGLSRDKIMLVASRMFAEHGFSATSVRNIATECGITLPSIYHFFGDKESLYNECVAVSFSAAHERVKAAHAAGTTPRDRVQQVMIVVCDLLLNNDITRCLLQRAILRRDLEAIQEDTMMGYFPAQFFDVTEDIRTLCGDKDPSGKALALYALALGAVQYRPIALKVGMDNRMFSTPVHLAEYVLKTVLPDTY